MSANPSDCLKLGIHLEYLRGINSISAATQNDVRSFPYLLENQTALRYGAQKVVAVIQSLLALLEHMKLTKSLEAANDFRPMVAEVEEFLKTAPDPAAVTLLDHFANSLVRIAENVVTEVRQEIR
jgi:hypothetical protein